MVETLDTNNKKIHDKTIQIRSFNTKVEEKPFVLMYDSKMEPLYDATVFLNFDLNNQSTNTVLQSVTALKILYSYLEIFNISLDSLSQKQARAFLFFAKGVSSEGFIHVTSLKTIRTNETINAYLQTIRKFIRHLGHDNHVFLKKHHKPKAYIMPESNLTVSMDSYDISTKSNSNSQDEAPSYINLEEYKTLITTIKEHSSERNKILCRLMFEHGLRLGECLGLTLEDLYYKSVNQYDIEYSIHIRNRTSDTNEQRAKSCMKVFTTSDYKDKNYRKNGVGYQKIVISNQLAEELLSYINDAHNHNLSNSVKRYQGFSKADSVPGGNKNVHENYYVFLNSLARPLSANLFNKEMRVVFSKAGLHVDKVTKKHNLCHRLRHGYAMYLSNQLHLDSFDVKTLMRHKHISSTALYHNPTPEDISALQKKLISVSDFNFL